MLASTVFINNRSQAVRLPAGVRFHDGVKKVQVRALGSDRIISPVAHTWDSFFLPSSVQLTDDCLIERASQAQAPREGL